MSLLDCLRLERAEALGCAPNLLQVQVTITGEDGGNMEEGRVKLTGLTLTSATYNTAKVIFAQPSTPLPGPGGGGCGPPVRHPAPSHPHPLLPT